AITVVLASDGTNSWSSGSMGAGAYLIDAQYPGDANNDPSTSASIALVVKTPITINPATLPASIVGVAYSTTFTASGGTGSSTFSITGALPQGMTLSPSGTLSGTPTQPGTFNFTIKATDASGWSG
ncbi:putative Ig domain-containing protein, partial [Klebsiella pneumoniae]|uniref:putative Ig domain-containing protein n=1 Tax=Klebsiella pneumoniae TaxID=573 RepID=UPI003D6B9507